MADLKSIIQERRSIRRYQEKEVPEEMVQQILDSVRWAPSWANTQCWEVVVIKDPGVREAVTETLPKTNPARKGMAMAPLVIVLCAKLRSSGFYKDEVTTKHGDWFMFDLGIATQNICLTAHDLGLGTVVVGMFDHDRAKEVLKVEEGYEVVAILPMGFPAKDSPVPKRREISEFAHYETF
ncbi:MAG: nitroreductase family protein [Deltaproteobacteria bacterium]|nr:nitroreductase family protein [Deltaproteobacteria bacterium]